MKTLFTWEQELQKLTPPSSIQLGLDRIKVVFDRLTIIRPEHLFTVAGTNGKGSTVEMLSTLTNGAGYKTCQYTSPHLQKINERFRINGQLIEDESLAEGFEVVRRAQGEIFLTYFEFLTLAAFYIFSAEEADIWVLEIGLGGRLDAVNVIDPDVSIITSIAMDHVEYLGDTLEAIAIEKAGIMRPSRPVLIGEETVRPTFLAEADRCNAKIKWLSDFLKKQPPIISGQTLDLSKTRLPRTSVGLAVMAFLERGLQLPEQAQDLITSVNIPGRLSDANYQNHRITLDVGHNLKALEYVTDVMSTRIEQPNRVVIFSVLADKDAENLIRCINKYSRRVILVGIDGDRGRPVSDLVKRYKLITGQTPWATFDTITTALDNLSGSLESSDHILICGSFVLVADALQHDHVN